MRALNFRAFSFSLSSNLNCGRFDVQRFKPQFSTSKTHYVKLTFDDSQILDCLSQQRLGEAWVLLDEMPKRSFQDRVVCWTSLLSRFSQNGFIDEARTLFEIMPERNVVTYNAMLSGYVKCGRLSDACRFFQAMPEKNVVSWTSLLCGLANAGRIDEAREVFNVMPERNVVSWNSMVVGLIRSGQLEAARQVFDEMPVKSQVSWNVMIAGYSEHGRMDEARVLFDRMEDPNVVTWTSMVAGYCRAGNVQEGYYLFRKMSDRNVVSWTAMIGGFAWNGFYKEALWLFLEMKTNHELEPNGESFISLIYACAGIGFPRVAMQLHAQLIINCWDYNDYDGRVCKSLIHMYSMLGIMDFAWYIFLRNSKNCCIQSCNSIINGYIRIGELEKAQSLFDAVPVRDKISWTSMINGYFNVGQVAKACYLFNNMPDIDAVAWTVMISGHVQNELFAEAAYLFSEMRAKGVSPLNSTFSVLIGAAGAMAYLDQGRQFHCLLMKTQFEFDLFLQNSLISMYAKCGAIGDAYGIFSKMTFRDLVSWNSMIMGFSHHGLASEALEVFEAMLTSGTCPNSVTFLGILSACSHTGLHNQGWELFDSMSNMFAIPPQLEHCVCMINLLGRAGKVEEAEEFILKLPFEPDRSIWGALLGVCGFGKINMGVARRAAKRLLELDPLNVPAHVVLCNLHASIGQHAEERLLRKEMELKRVRKVPGCSWILLKGEPYVFFSGDRIHPLAEEILSLLFGIKDKLH